MFSSQMSQVVDGGQCATDHQSTGVAGRAVRHPDGSQPLTRTFGSTGAVWWPWPPAVPRRGIETVEGNPPCGEEVEMTALMPRLFTDLADWLETDFPSPRRHLIRVEEETTDRGYKVRAELPGVDPEKDIDVSV
jgi:hypothetical protein